jgi:DNA-binding transcriptional LysR family regulator
MLDWDDLRFFLALARHGSLSAAARELHVAQSTMGRRLASLEGSLGVRLLNRTPEGYIPTEAGEGVRVRAERLEAEAMALEWAVGGRDTRMAGLVRVTCAETLATHILAPCFALLHQRHPDLMIELIPSPHELSLSMREADISLRLQRPGQHDLVVRGVGSLGFGLFASPSYLDRMGGLDFASGCSGHYLVTQTEDIQDAAQGTWLAALAPRARVALQTSSHEAAVRAAIHGGGLACLARFRADAEPGLLRLAVPSPIPHAEMFLVVHQTPRIRVVLTQITAWMRRQRGDLLPSDASAP